MGWVVVCILAMICLNGKLAMEESYLSLNNYLRDVQAIILTNLPSGMLCTLI